jgi:peptide/nickel transport system permease protein
MKEIDSPLKRVVSKLKKNKLAMFGGFLILFTIVIALAGYLIMPDDSPNANEMHLEISTMPPGTKIKFKVEGTGKSNINNSFINKWINGRESNTSPELIGLVQIDTVEMC